VAQARLGSDTQVLHWPAPTPQIPDLNATVTTGSRKNAAGATAGLKTDLL
jgi:hypothetical protein